MYWKAFSGQAIMSQGYAGWICIPWALYLVAVHVQKACCDHNVSGA
jgi:hypothetical protein